jgi:hypothetical protein
MLSLKPGFNRAGTWRGPPRFLVWRRVAEQLELAMTEPETGWRAFGPLGSGASLLRVVLVRLLWFAIYPGQGIVGMPLGWAHGRIENHTVIRSGATTDEAIDSLEKLFSGQPDVFCAWLRAKMPQDLHPFQTAAVEADLEFLSDFYRLNHRITRKDTETNLFGGEPPVSRGGGNLRPGVH